MKECQILNRGGMVELKKSWFCNHPNKDWNIGSSKSHQWMIDLEGNLHEKQDIYLNGRKDSSHRLLIGSNAMQTLDKVLTRQSTLVPPMRGKIDTKHFQMWHPEKGMPLIYYSSDHHEKTSNKIKMRSPLFKRKDSLFFKNF